MIKPDACRNCLTRRATRPRGLCDKCSRTPGVRERFAPLPGHGAVTLGGHEDRLAGRKAGRGGVGVHGWEDVLMGYVPTEIDLGPTRWPPGTRGKVKAMIIRATLKKPLFHEADATWDELSVVPDGDGVIASQGRMDGRRVRRTAPSHYKKKPLQTAEG